MEAHILHYLSVFGLSMIKFFFGLAAGFGLKLPFLATVFLTISGMMASVILLTFGGTKLRRFILNKVYRKRKLFSPQNRRIVRVWRKYGIFGVSFLTPIFFSPTIGTLIAVAFGEKKIRIIMYMLISAVFWGFVLSTFLYFLGDWFAKISF